MTAKEYLDQARRLDKLINDNVRELERLHDLAAKVSSPSFGEKLSGKRNDEAPYVHYIDSCIDLEKTINADIDKLVALKSEIRAVIEKIANINEKLVLRLRYLQNYTWEAIAIELEVDKSTVRRWHTSALEHIDVPEQENKHI